MSATPCVSEWHKERHTSACPWCGSDSEGDVMSKVILVRMELAHGHDDDAELISQAMEHTVSLWEDELDSWSVEVVTEDAT